MVNIIYGKSWGQRGGQSAVRKSFSVSSEQALEGRIDKGSITDADIQQIIKSGDSKMMKKLKDKENVQRKKKSNMEQKYGITDKKLFDGVDSNNCFYKDIPLDKLEND